MQGIPVTPKSGLNAIEVAGVTIKMMQAKVQQIMQAGGVGTPADLLGLSTAAHTLAPSSSSLRATNPRRVMQRAWPTRSAR